jgi:hypothetical protein
MASEMPQPEAAQGKSPTLAVGLRPTVEPTPPTPSVPVTETPPRAKHQNQLPSRHDAKASSAPVTVRRTAGAIPAYRQVLIPFPGIGPPTEDLDNPVDDIPHNNEGRLGLLRFIRTPK